MTEEALASFNIGCRIKSASYKKDKQLFALTPMYGLKSLPARH
jgi:hypothetical protein